MFLNEADEKAVGPILLRGKLVCLAIAASPLIYFVVAMVLRSQGIIPVAEAAKVKAVRWALAVVGPAGLAAGFFIRSAMMRRAGKMGFDKAEQAAGVLSRATIVSAVFCEAPAITGLLSFLLGGSVELLGLFCGVSLLAIIAAMPTAGRVAMMLEDARVQRER